MRYPVLAAWILAVSIPVFAQETAPVAATRPSVIKPVVMKPISAAEEASYAAALQTRAQAVLDDLKLRDDAKADHVKKAVITQYRALRAWHDSYDEDYKNLNKNPVANAQPLAEIQATRAELHKGFLTALARDLSEEQIEIVKDRMTYGTVKVTYDEYLRQNPWLGDSQKAIVLATLKEARELAMDDGSQPEKAATFKRFKGRINNLLATWKLQAAATTNPTPAR